MQSRCEPETIFLNLPHPGGILAGADGRSSMPETLTVSDAENRLLHLKRGAAIEAAREDFLAFIQYTKPDYEVNFHHEVTAEFLQRWAEGKIKRLIIVEPPRNGKSEQVSRRLPAWMFGKNPNVAVMGTSYGASLARKMSRDVKQIMNSPKYQEVFPNVGLPGGAGGANRNVGVSTATEFDVAVRTPDNVGGFMFERSGAYVCAGVGGALTGMGADRLIIDDPFKDRKQADSKLIRDNVWDWYLDVAKTRLAPGGCILVTMTRWHEDDLVGRLLERAKKDKGADQWEVLHFEAIKEKAKASYDPRRFGDPLWPERYPKTELIKFKKSTSDRTWSSLMQGSPTVGSGNVVKREWARFWHRRGAGHQLPQLRDMDEVILSWDLNFKNREDSDDDADGSYVVGQVWAKKHPNYYLIAEWRKNIGFLGSLDGIQYLASAYPQAFVKLIENKANGPAVEETLKKEIAGLILVEPQGGKEARMDAVSPAWRSGNVYLPNPADHPWVDEWMGEVCGFPRAKYDDRADAHSQALFYWMDGQSQILDMLTR